DPNLSRRLADQAARHDIGTPMLEVVMQRGRQRQHRRRTAVSVMAVAAVCAATIVSVNVLSRPDDHGHAVTSPGPDGSTPVDDTTGASQVTKAHLVDSDLVWNRVDPDAAEAIAMFGGYTNTRIAGQGPFVAWSTAPGTPNGTSSDYQPMMWRSDDGQSWQQVPGLQLGVLGSVAERDGRFFAYGTTPAASTSGSKSDLALDTSDDGGLTWSAATLPIDTSDLADEPGVASVSVIAQSIAAGPTGVLALARIGIVLDTDLLPPEATVYGYNITSTGIDVNGPATCDTSTPSTTIVLGQTLAQGNCTASTVPAGTDTFDTAPGDPGDTVPAESVPTASASTLPAGANTTVPLTTAESLTWAELGISDTTVAALNSQLHAYFSPDGVTFTEVQAPPTGDAANQWDTRLTKTDSGFVTLVTTYQQPSGQSSNELFQTADGQSWTDIGPAPIANPDSFSSMGDQVVMSGVASGSRNPNDQAVAVRGVDGTWSMIEMKDLTLPSDGVKTSLFNGGLSVGPTGITMLATLYVDPVAQAGGLNVTRDGITMHADDASGNLTFLDASGTELGRIASYATTSALVSVDQQGNYHVHRDGAVAATFTQQDLTSSYPSNANYTLPDMFVLHSTDGVNWSRESLTDLAGQQLFGTGGVRLTDTQSIVAANVANHQNAYGTPLQTLLIGTLKS
ncbi:MAG: hypothetical protein JWN99_2671, partial [Ilumatobacteraceae bacterium]|nr:hypothetical protein [Ilumatobacteraceae bacterium]